MNISESTLELVREFKSSHPYRGSYEEKLEKYKNLLTSLNNRYGIEDEIGLVIPREGKCPSWLNSAMGMWVTGPTPYPTRPNTIYVRKFSVITFLHEYRHLLQTKLNRGAGRDKEVDARDFSETIYRIVYPVLARRAGIGRNGIGTGWSPARS